MILERSAQSQRISVQHIKKEEEEVKENEK